MPVTNGTSALRCLDCGKCTSVCPVARYNGMLSPRRLVRQRSIGGKPDSGEGLWSCLTCQLCDSRCPQEVEISATLPGLRQQARERGEQPPFTRCGAMESIAALQSRGDLQQDRLNWLPDDVRVDPSSKTLLWVGCAPYFDTFYAENGVKTVDAVIGTIRILNALGIEPAVRNDERCCGHDALWSGDQATFDSLLAKNDAMLADAAPELIVTACPECALTLQDEYPSRCETSIPSVKHIAEIVAEQAGQLMLTSNGDDTPRRVTFEDPCRLGRHQGKYDQPREALAAVPGLELKEMRRSKGMAACCAGSWLVCNQATKRIQTDLLKDAEATGGEMLVTACPKCLIHLKCAQSGDESVPGIPIVDLASVVAGALETEHVSTAK